MMMEFSKKPLLLLVVLALGVAGCPIQAGDQIPCVEDVTCPAQYPVSSAPMAMRRPTFSAGRSGCWSSLVRRPGWRR